MPKKKQTKKQKNKRTLRVIKKKVIKRKASKNPTAPKSKVLIKKATAKPATKPVLVIAANKKEIMPLKPVRMTPLPPPAKPQTIKIQNTRISKHVLNLKKPINRADPDIKTAEEKNYQQIFSKFQGKKQNIFNRASLFENSIKKNLTGAKFSNLVKAKPKKNKILPKTPIQQPALSVITAIKKSKPNLPLQPLKIGNLLLPATWLKAISAFIFVCFLVSIPLLSFNYYQKLQGKKNTVLAQAMQALAKLTVSQKAAAAKDLPNTQILLQQSAANFNQANAELNEINIFVKSLIKIIPETKTQFNTATNLLAAGEKLSSSAAILTEALDQLKINKSLNSLNLTGNLTILKNHLNLVLPDLQAASQELNKITVADLPAEYQAKAVMLRSNLPKIVRSLEYFNSVSDLLLKILGQETQKRYLLLFQNNNEIRPTGGFIGSYALIDIDRGNVTKINIPGGGPYDLKAGLKANIESPMPLHIINDRWEFQDANWFADLPLSAEKLNYLFEKSGGPTTDGIIFINATLIQRLLAVTGPIDLPNYQLQINQYNFINVIQKEVELNYDKEINRPKQIIADLTPLLINKLMQSDSDQLIQLLNLALTALNEKEIQFYFNDYELEDFVNQNNWGGKLHQTDNDYLNIVSTNIAGEKTDAKISQSAILKVEIQTDGSIMNTLTITKTHQGLKDEKFYGVANLDYLRIYVPKGSELIKAEGFYQVPTEFFLVPNHEAYSKDPDISLIEVTKNIEPQSQTEILSQENKTVFANWMKVEPGETRTVTIVYKLPFNLNLKAQNQAGSLWQVIKENLGLNQDFDNALQTYSLVWQKQSGKRDFNIHAEITFPKALNYKYIYPSFMQTGRQTFSYTTELNSDKILGIIFKP